VAVAAVGWSHSRPVVVACGSNGSGRSVHSSVRPQREWLLYVVLAASSCQLPAACSRDLRPSASTGATRLGRLDPPPLADARHAGRRLGDPAGSESSSGRWRWQWTGCSQATATCGV
jgi:hypothetical protein